MFTRLDYFKELLCSQCEQADATMNKMFDAPGLSEEDRQFLRDFGAFLHGAIDRFRVCYPGRTEVNNVAG